MADGEVEESTVDADPKSKIAESLEQWDREFNASLAQRQPPDEEIVPRNDEEIEDYKRRIGELESGNEALTAEHSELSARLEHSEPLAEFTDTAIKRLDQRDFDDTVKRFVSETGISERVAKMELQNKFLLDEEFRTAAAERFDNPERLENLVSEMLDELHDKYPRTASDHGMAIAIRLSRRVDEGRNYGSDGHVSLAGLSRGEFEKAKAEIFEDARAGRLSPGGGRSRGGFFRSIP